MKLQKAFCDLVIISFLLSTFFIITGCDFLNPGLTYVKYIDEYRCPSCNKFKFKREEEDWEFKPKSTEVVYKHWELCQDCMKKKVKVQDKTYYLCEICGDSYRTEYGEVHEVPLEEKRKAQLRAVSRKVEGLCPICNKVDVSQTIVYKCVKCGKQYMSHTIEGTISEKDIPRVKDTITVTEGRCKDCRAYVTPVPKTDGVVGAETDTEGKDIYVQQTVIFRCTKCGIEFDTQIDHVRVTNERDAKNIPKIRYVDTVCPGCKG